MRHNEAFYKAVWKLLVDRAGASPRDEEQFLGYFCAPARRSDFLEFCFGGNVFGSGGKFKRNSGDHYVAYYSEHHTPERAKLKSEIDSAVEQLNEQAHGTTRHGE